MTAIWVIAYRELKSFVTRPLFFGVCGLCTTFWSYTFLRDLGRFALASARPMGAEGANIHYQLFVPHLSMVHTVMLIMVPAFTMRLLAEEKRNRTYDLLMTAPISSYHITVGKFLGAFMSVMMLLGVSFIYPLSTAMLADFDWGPLVSSFVGLALVLGGYISIGLFSSALTSSPVFSVIMTFVFILICFFIGDGGQFASGGGFASRLFDQLSIREQLGPFIQGGYRFGGIVFFISFMALFLFFTDRVVESSRWRA